MVNNSQFSRFIGVSQKFPYILKEITGVPNQSIQNNPQRD